MEASVGRRRRRNTPLEGISAWVRNSPLMRYPDLGLICIGIFIMLVGVGAVVPVRTIYARNMGATLEEIGFMASSFLLGQSAVPIPRRLGIRQVGPQADHGSGRGHRRPNIHSCSCSMMRHGTSSLCALWKAYPAA